jgi:hypothetical protein
MFLKPEGLEKVRVSRLLSLVARLNLINRRGDTMEQQ